MLLRKLVSTKLKKTHLQSSITDKSNTLAQVLLLLPIKESISNRKDNLKKSALTVLAARENRLILSAKPKQQARFQLTQLEDRASTPIKAKIWSINSTIHAVL